MPDLTHNQLERITTIFQRVQSARRQLDALIGDNYLSPRVSVVGVHFNSFAAAVEQLRWAEKEWRNLKEEIESGTESAGDTPTRKSHS